MQGIGSGGRLIWMLGRCRGILKEKTHQLDQGLTRFNRLGRRKLAGLSLLKDKLGVEGRKGGSGISGGNSVVWKVGWVRVERISDEDGVVGF